MKLLLDLLLDFFVKYIILNRLFSNLFNYLRTLTVGNILIASRMHLQIEESLNWGIRSGIVTLDLEVSIQYVY